MDTAKLVLFDSYLNYIADEWTGSDLWEFLYESIQANKPDINSFAISNVRVETFDDILLDNFFDNPDFGSFREDYIVDAGTWMTIFKDIRLGNGDSLEIFGFFLDLLHLRILKVDLSVQRKRKGKSL